MAIDAMEADASARFRRGRIVARVDVGPQIVARHAELALGLEHMLGWQPLRRLEPAPYRGLGDAERIGKALLRASTFNRQLKSFEGGEGIAHEHRIFANEYQNKRNRI